MIHPDTELAKVNDVIGYGVFATRLIPRGTLTWVRCALDRAFTGAQVDALSAAHQDSLWKYGYHDEKGDVVLCWDHARFLNHSCAPTCISPGFDFDVAVRDVEPGEELTCDYGMLNLREPFACACGAPDCRRTIDDDWPTMAASWDERVRVAFPDVIRVAQPLQSFVPSWGDVESAARGAAAIPSCQVHRATSG